MFSGLFQDGLNCKKCKRSFKTTLKIQRHIKNVHLRRKGYNCEHCEAKFVSQTSKAHHLFKIHNVRGTTNTTAGGGGGEAADSNLRLQHIEFVKSNIAKAKTYETNGILHYECPLCQRVTMRSAGLRIHLRLVHLGIKSLECELCFKRFASSGTLSYHVNFTHQKEKNPQERSRHLEQVREITARAITCKKDDGRTYYQCEKCEKFLTGKQGLRLHLMSIHMIQNKDEK